MKAVFRSLATTSLVALTLSAAPPSARACPNCKEAIENQDGEGANLKTGYYYSILVMVAMPFTLLGTGAYLVTRAVRRGGLPEM